MMVGIDFHFLNEKIKRMKKMDRNCLCKPGCREKRLHGFSVSEKVIKYSLIFIQLSSFPGLKFSFFLTPGCLG